MQTLKETEWFSEVFKVNQSFAMKIDKVLYHKKSQYQDILVFNNAAYGNVLVLDGAFMLSDIDEHMYHKALSTYGMQNVSKAEDLNVLIIGGGDGGIVRDLIKNYESRIKQITLVDIDEEVINVSREFFPEITCELDNPKVKINCADGIQFIKDAKENEYDLIICDSTDPEGFALSLISEEFYSNVKHALSAEGAYCAQSSSPFFQKEELGTAQKNMAKIFNDTCTYYSPMLVYPGSFWSYTAGANKILDKSNLDISEFIK